MYIGFDNIVGKSVIGRGITGTLFNVNTLVAGVRGSAICVNGVDQHVQFGGHKDRCFRNASLCHQGFSFAFWMKLGNKSPESSVCQFIFTSVDINYANRVFFKNITEYKVANIANFFLGVPEENG